MEDRKRRFDDRNEVRGKIAEVLKKLAGNISFCDGTHIFTPHADVSDDGSLRLVVLPPENSYAKEETRMAFDTVLEYVRNNGPKPRYRGNRLLFLAPDNGGLARLRDAARAVLAWDSIVEDIKGGRLNIDLLQKKQAEKELDTASDVLPRVARDCYKWLLAPVQQSATDSKVTVETFPLNTSGSTLGKEVERVALDNELVIATWSPIHLRSKLKELYWKADKTADQGDRLLGGHASLLLSPTPERPRRAPTSDRKGRRDARFFRNSLWPGRRHLRRLQIRRRKRAVGRHAVAHRARSRESIRGSASDYFRHRRRPCLLDAGRQRSRR